MKNILAIMLAAMLLLVGCTSQDAPAPAGDTAAPATQSVGPTSTAPQASSDVSTALSPAPLGEENGVSEFGPVSIRLPGPVETGMIQQEFTFEEKQVLINTFTCEGEDGVDYMVVVFSPAGASAELGKEEMGSAYDAASDLYFSTYRDGITGGYDIEIPAPEGTRIGNAGEGEIDGLPVLVRTCWSDSIAVSVYAFCEEGAPESAAAVLNTLALLR